MSLEFFDIIAYLEDREVDYWLEGTNCHAGWVNINCPFCDDPSNHCGIHIDRKAVNCWRCGRHKLYEVIMYIDDCSKGQALHTIDYEYQNLEIQTVTTPPKPRVHTSFEYKDIMPTGCLEVLPQIHKDYLIKRGFDPDFIVKAYKVRGCYNIGRYKYRLIIPVIYNGWIVNYIARDVTNRHKTRYKTCPDSEALVPLEDLFYNLDTVEDKAVLVEGVFDVWRIGPGAIASFGIQLSNSQLDQLSDLKKLTILFDSDAKETADSLAEQLVPYINDISVIYLKEGHDPADLDETDVNNLRKDFLS